VTRSTVTHPTVRTRVATALLGGTALATVMLVAGCSAGQLSQTAEAVPAVPGANSVASPGDENGIALRNVLIEYPGVQGYRVGDNASMELRLFNNGPQAVSLVQVTTPAASSVVQTGSSPITGAASPTPTATGTPTDTSGSASASATASPTAVRSSASAKPTGSPNSASPSASGSASAEPSQPAGRPINVQIPSLGYAVLAPSVGSTLELVGLTRSLNAGESIPITFGFSNGVQVTLDVPVDVPLSAAPRSPMVFPSSEAGVS
jgi:copper(I)-binding protein